MRIKVVIDGGAQHRFFGGLHGGIFETVEDLLNRLPEDDYDIRWSKKRPRGTLQFAANGGGDSCISFVSAK